MTAERKVVKESNREVRFYTECLAASRRSMMRIMAMRTKAVAMRQCRSKSRARRRYGKSIRWCAPRSNAWQYDELVPVAAADDLDFPRARAGNCGGHLRPSIARVTDDALDEGEQLSRLAQQRFAPIAVLRIGRMHDDREQHVDGVGQQVTLAADDFLARVVARRIERRAPFCATFAVWLSMIAVVGLVSRPACSRTAT